MCVRRIFFSDYCNQGWTIWLKSVNIVWHGGKQSQSLSKGFRLPGVVAKARSNFWLVQLFEILYDRHMLQVTTAARVCAKALQRIKLLLARTSGHWHSAFNVRAVLLSNTFPGWIKAGMTERRHLKNPLAKAQNRKYRWYLLVSALDTQSKF